ncbi:MAG: hypothetical protein JNL58_23850 [Planctomyces sp.]|nr:hypothetical protein [Planctomyces sp.]
MSGPLDDLDFSINAHVRDAMEDIRDLSRQLDGILNHVDRMDAAFRAMGDAIGIPTAQVDLLLLRMQPMMNTLDKAKKQASGLEESFTRKLMAKALEEHQRKIVRLADGTERAKYQMIALADASRQIRTPEAGRVSSGQNSGVNFVRVTAAAGQLALLGRISGTLRNVRTGIGEVGTQTRISAGYMTRFRMGMNSIPVNPALNVVKNSFTSLGEAASKGVETLRGMADAFLSDIPGSIAAAVGAAGQMGQSFDAVSNTVSKHVHKLHETQSALTLLSTVFPFAKSQIETIRGPLNAVTSYADAAAEKIDEMNAKFGTAAAEARGKAWVMTGVWKELGGTADTFARSQYYALLPQRMMMREVEGARRIIRAATYAWTFLTHPIHSVSLALAQSRAEWKDLRSRLPPLTGGLQLGTRAFRAFAQTAFIVGTTTRTVVTALTPLAKLTVVVARGTWSMVGPIRSATMGLIRMTGVQNTVIGRMLGMKKSTDEASAAMARLDRGNSLLSRGFGAVSSRAGLAKTAAAGLIATMVAVGTSTAIATEKNNAVFGTMLGDMQQGSAVVKSLQNTEAGKLFDNQELLDSGRLLLVLHGI